MGYSSSDAAHDAADAARAEAALDAALEAADSICTSFVTEHQDSPLSPDVSVSLEVGAEDQPVFVFSLLVELEDDLDPNDFPEDEIETLQSALRARIVNTPVDDWDWIVTTGTKAGAARR
jgi:hypothetical protein